MNENMRSKAQGPVRASSTTRPIRPLSSHMLRLLLQCVLFLFLTVSEAICNPQDRESLMWFSGNLSSSVSPLNWNPSIDCCSWEGITCDDSMDSRVTAISLTSKGLSGNLSLSLLHLRHLSQLNLSHNRLSGPLPPGFLSSLDKLIVLDLSYNSFDGELPLEQAFGNGSSSFFSIQTIDLSSNLLHGEILGSSVFLQGASNLISFNVSNNTFTGQFPSFMCTGSPNLSKLDISYNDFTGNITQGLGRCLRLTVLRAGFNKLSGEIPSEIYNLSELEQLSLPANQLSGKIDDDITRLRKLTTLDLYFNHLEGEIPVGIGNLSSLRSLQLHINNLTGSVPLSLAICTHLVRLNLRVNRLRGSLTELDFSQLQSLTILDLGNNSFTGDFPDKVFSCKSLTDIRFAGNMLSGQMKLYTLLVSKNFHNETLPSNGSLVAPDGFPKLQIFGISGCKLKGEIPAWLIKLKSLQVIDLSFNRLEGSIPGWLGTFPHLFYIDLSDNLLSGELPRYIFNLRALMSQKAYDARERNYLELTVFVSPNDVTNQQYNQLSSLPPAIYISRNNLTGSIPMEVGQFKVLHVLELSHNNLSGSIPDELSNLTNLERLDLSNNALSGRIPLSLTSLHFLSYFNVANNTLQGPIPPSGQFATYPKAYYEGNPLLCDGVLLTSCKVPSNTAKDDTGDLQRTFFIGVAIGFFVSYCFYWCSFAMRFTAFTRQ
ncbi:unnamed protein product [Thlaspi arvense]|uniref:Leucine-rich repeat-containing N-terminal plant-type domain-containing protein n=1 Tax=Thlaspi arvense TaxID=13288 RepID=A0AAU9RFL8_THLAR|nr:unnamed protein product [Thlaspi arvense]